MRTWKVYLSGKYVGDVIAPSEMTATLTAMGKFNLKPFANVEVRECEDEVKKLKRQREELIEYCKSMIAQHSQCESEDQDMIICETACVAYQDILNVINSQEN